MMPKSEFQAKIQNGSIKHITKFPFKKKLIEIRGCRIQPVYKHGFIHKGHKSEQIYNSAAGIL
ncbi:MAG: hypothetical protein IT292_05185 [Deltaproteobacteria bacterium]|nr:hypothetical protein [Deltaproteobacteria bacterium]